MPSARVTSGKRVTLRTAENEDVPFLQRSLANPEIRLPLGNPVMNCEQYELSTERTGPDQFIVCLEGADVSEASGHSDVDEDGFEGRRIGGVNVADAHYKRPELGYWLLPEFRGEGYGSEAVSLAIDYAFRSYDTPAVGAGVYDFNDASQGLLESLGFVEEGRQRKFMFVDGAHRDLVRYGLLRAEWYNGESPTHS